MRNVSIALVTVFCSAVGLACGGDDSTAASNSDGGGGGDGAMQGDGGGGGDGAGGTTKTGLITLAQQKVAVVMPPMYSATGSAGFSVSAGSGGGGTSCTLATQGSCKTAKCTLGGAMDAGVVDAGSPAPVNAGDITISGGKLTPAMVLKLGPTGYAPVTIMTQAFAPGDMMSAASAGGPDVPMFGAQTVAAPGDLTLTAPACAMFMCPGVDRSVDLPLAWTGITAGSVEVLMETSTKSEADLITCSFDGASGMASIPTAALAVLSIDPTATGFFSASPAASTKFLSGDWQLTFAVRGQGGGGTFKVTK